VCEERDRMILIVGFFYGRHGHSLREEWKCPWCYGLDLGYAAVNANKVLL